jgi:hypothetical protein
MERWLNLMSVGDTTYQTFAVSPYFMDLLDNNAGNTTFTIDDDDEIFIERGGILFCAYYE